MGGPAKETRPVLATVTGMRHVGLCLLIALNTFPDPAVQAPLVAFSALMVPPNTLFAAYTVIRSRMAARALQK
jgi:BASS family bile acid:Na+ symporter